MFWEPFIALISLDINAIIGMLANNLFWVFVYYAMAYFFFGPKNTIRNTLLITAYNWLAVEFVGLLGWVVLTGTFLGMNYLVRLSAVMYTENSQSLVKRTPFVLIGIWFVLIFVYNVFMR